MEDLQQLRRRRDQGDRPAASRSRSLRGSGGGKKSQDPAPPEKAASFHGRTAAASQVVDQPRQMRRPKTQPNLLAGTRMSVGMAPGTASSDGGGWAEVVRRVPAKVLVNVMVQRSLFGPLQVMASTEWTVAELMAAAVRQYVKEGRRPALPTTDPSFFSLHYSQFSLEGLDPKEKLFVLGSRNFFLCIKPAGSISSLAAEASSSSNSSSSSLSSTSTSSSSSSSSSSTRSSSCSNQAEKASMIYNIPWLKFIDSMF